MYLWCQRRGVVKGACTSQLKLLQHLSGCLRTDKREYCSRKLKPCGKLKVKGFSTNPGEFSRDLISEKIPFTVSLFIVSNYYLSSCFKWPVGFDVLFSPCAPVNVFFSVVLYLLYRTWIQALCHWVKHTVVKENMKCVLVGVLGIIYAQQICLSQQKGQCVTLLWFLTTVSLRVWDV